MRWRVIPVLCCVTCDALRAAAVHGGEAGGVLLLVLRCTNQRDKVTAEPLTHYYSPRPMQTRCLHLPPTPHQIFKIPSGQTAQTPRLLCSCVRGQIIYSAAAVLPSCTYCHQCSHRPNCTPGARSHTRVVFEIPADRYNSTANGAAVV